ncbi:hypothetical protein [Palleronia pelagia]|uniref:Uncharacterized protein n=1 Tax=Palleronia pelagia TaxID=387096 RepID=A0A1H8DA13_9RHOB|nr:hypothetical protein [Palleronia pelagia]SEN03398.1 hypothetical protein SAMN04488011_102245 [Palleronia pelagia]
MSMVFLTAAAALFVLSMMDLRGALGEGGGAVAGRFQRLRLLIVDTMGDLRSRLGRRRGPGADGAAEAWDADADGDDGQTLDGLLSKLAPSPGVTVEENRVSREELQTDLACEIGSLRTMHDTQRTAAPANGPAQATGLAQAGGPACPLAGGIWVDGTEARAPVIDDFDPDEDQLVIVYDPHASAYPRISVHAVDGTEDVLVRLDGQVMMRVIGGAGRVDPDEIELIGSDLAAEFAADDETRDAA